MRLDSTNATALAALAIMATACGAPGANDAGAAATSAEGALGAAGAHEHGVARVNVAIDGSTATIEFFAPGQSIYGFEGRPRTDEEAAKRAAGLEQLAERLPRMFVFDPLLDCRFDSPNVRLEGDDHTADGAHHHDRERHADTTHQGHAEEHTDEHEDEPGGHAHEDDEHGEVHAEVEVRCGRSPIGTDLRLDVASSFPDITYVDLQVLSDAVQSGARVRASGHVAKL